jgi:outer membrane protein
MLRFHSRRWLSVLSLPVFAAGLAQAQVKVAVINSQTALSDTAEIKKAQADLEAKFKPRQEQMAKLQKEIETIKQQLDLGDKLTAQAQADLNTQGSRKQRELSRLTEDLQSEVDRERSEIISRSSDRMQKVVVQLAEEQGVDLVVDTATTLYFKPTLDLTKQATAAYDKAYPPK